VAAKRPLCETISVTSLILPSHGNKRSEVGGLLQNVRLVLILSMLPSHRHCNLSHWCRKRGWRGWKHTPKDFELVKIPAKSFKIRAKSFKILEKSLKTFTNSLKIWANSLKVWAKMAPKMVWAFFIYLFFLEVTFLGVFSGKFGRIRAKILRTRKNLPAPTPVVQAQSFALLGTDQTKHDII